MATQPGGTRKRGIFLSSFLVLLGVVNIITGLYFLLAFAQVKQNFPALPDIAIIIYGLLCLANAGFAVAIWKWHKWGIFGYVGSVTAAYIFNVIMTGSFTSVMGFLGLVVLIIMIFPIRKQFH